MLLGGAKAEGQGVALGLKGDNCKREGRALDGSDFGDEGNGWALVGERVVAVARQDHRRLESPG